MLALTAAPTAARVVSWVQTARFDDGSTHLLKPMPPLTMEPVEGLPTERVLEVDTGTTYQELLGFGGAFTEATAINWRKLSATDQAKVIRLYFGPPEEGGHGYTLGRVPINSCDFSPASYSFDDVAGDVELKHFDKDVTHDVEVGMIPMILQAQAAIEARGHRLNLYGSPWSPPAWMKLPAWGQQSMVLSDTPNCLMPSMQRPWARYFSKFIDAYRRHGINMWGVTVQNEPEAAVGWEACLYNASFMAAFVRDHLGPVLAAEQPKVKILGFDHNKDHMLEWAQGLYADPEAAQYFHGIGVHWYGGLNQAHMQATHELAPNKVILATEACNCGGVVFKDAAFASGNLTKGKYLAAWWTRAELLGLDILVDLAYWAVGWTDWNLLLDVSGGPNHLKNLCDANIIVDPDDATGHGTPLVMQASYYYMGHFSRYLPPGSKRVALQNSVEAEDRPLDASDVKNGQAMIFAPCDGSDVQKWQYDGAHDALIVKGTDDPTLIHADGYGLGGMCMSPTDPPAPWIDGQVHVWGCNFSLPMQTWTVREVPGGKQLFSPATGKCLEAIATDGGAVGLDKGLKVVAGQLKPCLAAGAPTQTFTLANDDKQGFPDGFPVRLLEGAANPFGQELCLMPQIQRTPRFDAVAFQTPDGGTSLVAINIGDDAVEFTVVDKGAKQGVRGLVIPPHAIQTYTWKPEAAAALFLDGPDGGAPAGDAAVDSSSAVAWWPIAVAGCALVLAGAGVVALIVAKLRKQVADGATTDNEYLIWEPYKGKEGGFVRRKDAVLY